MTEREKMLAGELYDYGDPELLTQRHKPKDLTRDYNRERFKFCVNRKTDIRYVISYRGQNLFFRVLSLFVL